MRLERGEDLLRQGIYLDSRTERYILSNCSAQPGELQAFYLFGKEYILGGEHYYVIRAAMEAENEAFRRGKIQFSYSVRGHLEHLRQTNFSGLWLIGWAVNQPGHGIYDVQKYWALHDCFFGDCSVLMMLDGREDARAMYFWDGHELRKQREYHLFDDPRPKVSLGEVDCYETRSTRIS
jgi:hypothetical protein